MAINKNKIVAQAQRFTGKGQFEKAINEYQRFIKAYPESEDVEYAEKKIKELKGETEN